jgi:hypothetical protein
LARAIAAGTAYDDAAMIYGYAPTTVRTLMSDPTFKQAVSFYQRQMDETVIDLGTRMAMLAAQAAEELMRRLEDNPDDISDRMLHDIIVANADRTGFGPQTKNLNINANVDLATRLETARKRLKEIVDATDRSGVHGRGESSPNDGHGKSSSISVGPVIDLIARDAEKVEA